MLRLSPELERALLAGVLYGARPLEAGNTDELSPVGQTIFKAATDLFLAGNTPPLALSGILLILTDVYGANKDAAKAGLEAIHSSLPSATGAAEVVRKLREKYSLL